MQNVSRAAFLVPSDRLGGAEKVVRSFAAAAIRSGAFDEVHVFVLCWSNSGSFESLSSFKNVHVHYTNAANEIGGVASLGRFLCQHNYDFVLSSATHLNAFASMLRSLGLLRTKRLVARESTVIFDRSFGRRGIVFRALYWLYGRQDIIICQSERMRASLDKNTGGRLRHLLVTLSNPLEHQRCAGGSQDFNRSAQLRIAWCGRLSVVKSPALALDVVANLANSGHDVRLRMIGDGPLMSELQLRAHQLAISNLIDFVGFVEDPSEEFRKCNVGLITSETEGFPNVLLEMVANGIRSVVTTDCAGGLEEVPGVTVVASREASALASALIGSKRVADDEAVNRLLERHSPDRLFKIISGLANSQ